MLSTAFSLTSVNLIAVGAFGKGGGVFSYRSLYSFQFRVVLLLYSFL